MKKYLIPATIIAAGLATSAFAQNNNADDAAMQNAKVTTTQAIQNAEAKAAGGKVTSIDFDVPDKGGAPYYAIEITDPDGKQQKLEVNATSGEVTSATKDDNHDGDGGNDNEEQKNN